MTPRDNDSAGGSEGSEQVAPAAGLCQWCAEELPLRDGLIPYHDFPKPCRSVCRGSKHPPMSAADAIDHARVARDGEDS